MNYTLFLISNKPQYYKPIQDSLSPEILYYFDGTGAESFSKLVNSCVESSPTETIIMMSDKVLPTQEHVHKVLQLLEDGYAFVGLYSFAFFGFKKELFRKIGMMDERYVGGGFEDYDFFVRLSEAKLAVYNTQEVPYTLSASSWNYDRSYAFWTTKWCHFWTEGNPIPRFERRMWEEQYNYNLGPSIPTKFLSSNHSNVVGDNIAGLFQISISKDINLPGCEIINNLYNIEQHSYLELGVRDNINFNVIKCKNKSSVDVNGAATFTGTTDEYFSSLSPEIKFDIIYIDANHDFDFVLRDFNNSVDHANKWIIIHDMIPPTEEFSQNCLCSDSYKLLYHILKEENFEIYPMDNNFGLTLIKCPVTKVYPPEAVTHLLYTEFVEYMNTQKVYSDSEIIEILGRHDV
jgi:hypothetical protein